MYSDVEINDGISCKLEMCMYPSTCNVLKYT